ncbi:MAG: HmuY family protein [Flavobacteriales bacterium]|nr:HmuY family protein [Flavobacteriales bacterium]MCX7767940.1 HmuY family protein [Flavobacteriales bacterium]MDW8409344.1 HmuY family protein [Flavobacteriales bacterium]
MMRKCGGGGIWLSGLVGIFLTGCFKKDEPRPPYQSPGGVNENVAALGPLYARQLWFDLETNTFVKEADRGLWDLAFDSRPGRFGIRLNSSKKMRMARLGHGSWDALPADPGNPSLDWRYDESTGHPDSTAFGQIGPGMSVPSEIYLVDLGFSPEGDALGFAYFQLLEANTQYYKVACALYPDGTADTLTLPRRAEYNFVHLSFQGGAHYVLAEPPAADWDLVFTQYTTRVYYEGSSTQFEWYSVNGVLINPAGTQVARDTVSAFEALDYMDALEASYSSLWDAIGYNWKSYVSSLGAYIVRAHYVYLIRTAQGHYYKWRFIGFTNSAGERGYPTFQYSQF